jgi:ElaB/YqjD/DUF883 family membrane-anchored ribosome-binding protein
MAERNNIGTQLGTDETQERSARAIRQDIAAKRETISETVDKLGERIHQTLDWREYVAEYPAVALGAAAGIGFLIAGMFKREPTPKERIMDAVADLTDDLTDRVKGMAGEAIKKQLFSSRTVKAAVTAAITKAALDFAKKQAKEMIAGNREQPDASRQITTGTQISTQPASRSEEFNSNIHTSQASMGRH